GHGHRRPRSPRRFRRTRRPRRSSDRAQGLPAPFGPHRPCRQRRGCGHGHDPRSAQGHPYPAAQGRDQGRPAEGHRRLPRGGRARRGGRRLRRPAAEGTGPPTRAVRPILRPGERLRSGTQAPAPPQARRPCRSVGWAPRQSLCRERSEWPGELQRPGSAEPQLRGPSPGPCQERRRRSGGTSGPAAAKLSVTRNECRDQDEPPQPSPRCAAFPGVTVGRESLTLVWFRDDLRVDDHEALTAARADGRVVGIWLRESRDASGLGPRPLGGAARWWAHASLRVLEAELSELGIPLLFAACRGEDIVCQVVDDLGIDSVRWSRRLAPASRSLDARIEARLTEAGVAVHSHPGAVLVEPWTTSPQGGDFYKVFTPFFKATRDHEVGQVLPAPNAQTPPSDSWLESARAHDWASDLDGLGLLDGTATGSGDFASARTPPWWRTTVA